MKQELATSIGIAATAVAAAAVMVFATDQARADDITVDKTPFVSSTSRDEVLGIVKANPEVVRRAASEWALQENYAPRVQSAFTSDEARSAYIKERRAVHALYGEDSGSNSPWLLKAGPNTSMMGGPSR
jgi:hypothetical protein